MTRELVPHCYHYQLSSHSKFNFGNKIELQCCPVSVYDKVTLGWVDAIFSWTLFTYDKYCSTVESGGWLCCKSSKMLNELLKVLKGPGSSQQFYSDLIQNLIIQPPALNTKPGPEMKYKRIPGISLDYSGKLSPTLTLLKVHNRELVRNHQGRLSWRCSSPGKITWFCRIVTMLRTVVGWEDFLDIGSAMFQVSRAWGS